MNSGPGLKPHSTSAASKIAVVPLPGMPSVSSGTSAPPVSALFAPSGAATPSIAPCAELLRMLGHRLLDAVAEERRDRGAGPGRMPTMKPTSEPLTKAKRQSFMSCQVGSRLRRPFGTGSMPAARCWLHVGQHFADREHADGNDDEVDAAEQRGLAEGEARGRA